MDRGDHRCVDEAAVGEREEVETVVDEVELVGALEHRRDVEAFGDLGVDGGVFGPAVGGGAVERGCGHRVGRGEQGDVVAGGHEALGEQ